MSALTEGLHAAIKYLDDRGGGRPPRWKPPTGAEIKQMRLDLGLSQPEFATRYGLNLKSLRKWEQGIAEPEQVTAMVLHLIRHDPKRTAKAVEELRRDKRSWETA